MYTVKDIFYLALTAYIGQIVMEVDLIPEERKMLLRQLATYIRNKLDQGERVTLNFICTHNSRRSHISQIWAATAAAWYGLDHISTYSGGTEATAFNPRAVKAMERAGFHIYQPRGENPHYNVRFSEYAPALECFSKTYDDPFNPAQGFAAIMTCSDADEHCPYIPGTELRLALTYSDPKEADGTTEEANRYDERVRQIGREIFYAMHLVHQLQ
ncbi:MAG: protein-tyrosine-phosphatase [Lewinella sp.]|nr:protein-tyrosine-phosphatase [Lewinella sp.]